MTAPSKPRRHGSQTLDYRRHDGVVALLATVLEGTADLKGAACQGLGRLYDPDIPHGDLGYTSVTAREAAVEDTCIGCPARARCWSWAARQQRGKVTGPTAASSSIGGSMRWRGARRAQPPEPTPARQQPRRRGARARVRPSVNRRRRRR